MAPGITLLGTYGYSEAFTVDIYSKDSSSIAFTIKEEGSGDNSAKLVHADKVSALATLQTKLLVSSGASKSATVDS